MRRWFIIILALVLVAPAVFAQSERRCVRHGNRQFKKEHYSQAEIDYKKALLADSLSSKAMYNLGNTYYRMDDPAQAQKSLEAAVDSLAGTPYGADAYHNLGNALLRQENYQGAVEAYKNSLRRRPDDMETKTNLAYALKKLQEQQDQEQNQDQNQDNQDQNQDNQDQNQNDQNQDNKDQDQDQNKDNQDQNKDQDKNDDKQDQNQQDQQNKQNDQNNDSRNDPREGQAPPPKISQQDAQQILQAIQDKENETQEKVKAEKALLLKSRQKDKNW